MLTVVAEAFTDVGDATLVESEHELPENQLDPIYDEHVVTPTEHERIVETLTKLLFTTRTRGTLACRVTRTRGSAVRQRTRRAR